MRTLGELVPSNALMHRHVLENATADLQYLVSRRDQLTEKIRFGLVALNGGSLVALLGALGGSGQAAAWLGFSSGTALISAVSFSVGLLLAGWSLTSQQNLSIEESGDAFARVAMIQRLVIGYELVDSQENRDHLEALMIEYEQLPLVGFRFRNRSIFAQNFSAGLWFFGIAVPLGSALGIRIPWPWI